MKVFGNKNFFAIEVGNLEDDSKSVIQSLAWLDGSLLNPVCNSIYLPTFWGNLKKDIEFLENLKPDPDFTYLTPQEAYSKMSESPRQEHKVLSYDLGACFAHCYYFLADKKGRLLAKHWDERHADGRAEVLCEVYLDKGEFISILREVLESLPTEWF